MTGRPPSRPGDYLAAERTFLAWIRTGLALMGFGFVVARFGLFLQALEGGRSSLQFRAYGPSFWFGTALIALGVVVNIVCARNHFVLVRELNRGGSAFNRPSWLAMGVALILAAVGLAMAIYLIAVGEPGKTNSRREKTTTTDRQNGIVTIGSHHSVEQTAGKLEEILRETGVKLFALIDHDGEAARAGMHVPATRLLISGNPKAGTPLMIASLTIALDLPLKILVWQDTAEKVWISYNSPACLQTRHGLSEELLSKIAVVETLAKAAAE
jgi:uncharacterized protein (DUF302 family)/uncharacterized membrane protein YidH (DUF202 family)